MCEKDKPDATLIRESTLSSFVEECGLAHYPDMTGRVQLHYAPKRGDGTLPVSSRIPFAVSEEGGAHGRVWYFCMPIPVPVQAPQKGVIPPPTDSRQAVCRYAGSGVDRMEIVHDDQDAQKYDPRNW